MTHKMNTPKFTEPEMLPHIIRVKAYTLTNDDDRRKFVLYIALVRTKSMQIKIDDPEQYRKDFFRVTKRKLNMKEISKGFFEVSLEKVSVSLNDIILK